MQGSRIVFLRDSETPGLRNPTNWVDLRQINELTRNRSRDQSVAINST
ncbi:hypothetical protein RMSM_02022 [Rhodopirellula maiorica SM1]|uniref:Uncharacterized protein n=1 Tax=Rhodopirellula maiorica SM1 TaxID=1265738 RepID=M5RP26_9BACT|nr:hypothetical protein RMSM_02022 [Rhodopirellula maiorica SM1]